jgi:hypothetical protein
MEIEKKYIYTALISFPETNMIYFFLSLQLQGNIIVVTTAPNLNLNSGNACKSVLREGGQDLQNECKEKYPNEIKFGEIAVVHGHGALECNFVYLTTLPNWNSEHNPQQVGYRFMCTTHTNKHAYIYACIQAGTHNKDLLFQQNKCHQRINVNHKFKDLHETR